MRRQAGLSNANNDIDFEETWSVISSSLTEMHTKNASQLSFETIYRHGYKIVLKKKGEVFYDRLQKFEQDWLGNRVQSGLRLLVTPLYSTMHKLETLPQSTSEGRQVRDSSKE